MNGLPQPAYVMSEPHLSGYRVIIGYETLTDVQNAQAALCKPQAREEAPADSAHPCYDEHQAGCDCEILSQSATPTPSYLERLSAPAEAGEDVELIAALRSMPRCHCAGDDWPSLYDRAADRLEALRAQPQAREEAQPVAWVVRKGLSTGSLFYTERGQNADLPDGTLLYTTPPAPEAENLRVAVEALEKASRAISEQYALAQAEYHHLDTVASKHDKIVQEGRRAIREALAALQQEGR